MTLRPALKALTRIYAPQAAAGSSAFLRAEFHAPLFQLPSMWGVVCEQSFRPLYDGLPATLHRTPRIEAGSFDEIIILGSRSRHENTWLLEHASTLSAEMGRITIALENDLGGKTLRRDIGRLFEQFETTSLGHSQIVTIQDPKTITPTHDLRTHPGQFSYQKVDKGTALLLSHLATNLTGDVLDLGSGDGILSQAVLEHNPVASLTLVDAEWWSLRAAEERLSAAQVPTHFVWEDLSSWKTDQRFHVVIMNPPFHDLVSHRPSLVEAFITRAHSLLLPTGVLLLVTLNNRPVSEPLNELFRKVERVVAVHPYEVWHARDPFARTLEGSTRLPQ